LSGRIESLERALSDRDASIKASTDRSTRSWRFALGALAAVVVVGALLAMRLAGDIRDARERAARAEQAQAAAITEATRQVVGAREEAARQIADASQRADRAQIVSEVLAAPDSLIFNLIGRRALTGLSAQLRWSASRGLVFSGPRLPAPPSASTYQLWLLTRGGAWSAGTFAPDASAAVTLALAAPSTPQPVIGALVTIEPEGGRTSPLGEAVFTRLPLAAPAETP
jgi:anti-sigma-K factor RskA